MTNPARKNVSKEVDTIDLEYLDLDDALIVIQKLINDHGGDAKISKETYPYSDTIYFGVFKNIPETDEEMNARLAREKAYTEAKLERDRREFERLSAQFAEKK